MQITCVDQYFAQLIETGRNRIRDLESWLCHDINLVNMNRFNIMIKHFICIWQRVLYTLNKIIWNETKQESLTVLHKWSLINFN